MSQFHCSFCGRPSNEVKKLIAGDSAMICDMCIETCYDTITLTDIEPDKSDEIDIPSPKNPSPREIKNFLDQYIIGQESAKMIVSVAAHNHYKRLSINSDEIEVTKSNILMIGPTGSGKTLIAETLAKCMNVPCVLCDATSLTETGYVGDDVDGLVSRLFASSGNDKSATEMGIIFIDEIDKKRTKKSESRDISGEGVQQTLLRLLEGTDIIVGKRHGNDGIKINTKNILFILSGAFVGLDTIINSNKTRIGFSQSVTTEELTKDIKSEHLTKFGIIPELVGRMPIIAPLEKPTEDELIEILTSPKNAIIKQFQAMFMAEKVDLYFDEEVLREVARRAIKDDTGARGLRGVIEKALMKIQFDLPELVDAGLEKVIVDINSLDSGEVLKVFGKK